MSLLVYTLLYCVIFVPFSARLFVLKLHNTTPFHSFPSPFGHSSFTSSPFFLRTSLCITSLHSFPLSRPLSIFTSSRLHTVDQHPFASLFLSHYHSVTPLSPLHLPPFHPSITSRHLVSLHPTTTQPLVLNPFTISSPSISLAHPTSYSTTTRPLVLHPFAISSPSIPLQPSHITLFLHHLIVCSFSSICPLLASIYNHPASPFSSITCPLFFNSYHPSQHPYKTIPHHFPCSTRPLLCLPCLHG